MLWSDAQFNAMCWHDNHVHGLRIVAGEHGCGQLLLDIDYILDWGTGDDGRYLFSIVPAELRFDGVCGLRIEIDFKSSSAALGPFCIDCITVADEQRTHHVARLWTIALNWPSGEISFEADGFEQRATGDAVLTSSQSLLPVQRSAR